MRFYYATENADQNSLKYLGNFKTFREAETDLYHLTKDLRVTSAFLYVPVCHFSIFAENRAGGSRFRLVRALYFTSTPTVIKREDEVREVQVDTRKLRKAS